MDICKSIKIEKALLQNLNKKQEFEQLVLDHLPKEKGEQIMQTIADSYIEEGINKGITLGKNEGIAIGKNEGITLGIEKIAKRMLKEKVDIKFISSVTSLSIDEVLKLKNKL